jgi:hypothetical protein
MKKLKAELDLIYKQKLQIMMPRNCQMVKMKLVSKKKATILGKLAINIIDQ